MKENCIESKGKARTTWGYGKAQRRVTATNYDDCFRYIMWLLAIFVIKLAD